MKKNSSAESGILSARLLLALALCSIGAWFTLISVAAPAPSAPQAPTTTITVTTAVQKISSSGGCSLQEAILSSQHHSSTFAAPNNPAVTIMSGCTAGSGNDTIVLPGGAVFQMSAIIDDPNNFTGPAANPMIRSNIIIEANGSRIEHVPNGINFRAFAVGSDGSLAIRNAHIKGFTFKGGDGYGGGGGGMGAGGAIYVYGGSLMVESSTFEGNGAAGGNAGPFIVFPDGQHGRGGGGGLAGNGGKNGYSGGGGGGARGSGGDARTTLGVAAGSGGGGTVGSGAVGGFDTGGAGGFDCGGKGGDFAFFNNGQNGQCPGGGGGGGGAGDSSTFHSGGTGGNGEYGGGGGGGGEGYGASDGGNGGFGGGGGASSGRGIFASAEGGDGGFGGGGATSNEIPGAGGKFGGNASEAHAGGGAALGGAIFNDTGSVTILNSTFTGNFVVRGCKGGGCDGTDTVAQNGQDEGAAIFSHNGSLAVYNSTISGNESTGEGGGIVVVQVPYVVNVGGVDVTVAPPTSFHLYNTILANQTARECFFQGPSVTHAGSGNLIRNNFGCPGNIAPNPPDPQLGPLQINPPGSTPTMAIDGNSPAFDAGDDAHPPSYPFDQRGVPRPQFAHIDIGAYEFAACTELTCPADVTQSNDAGECGAVVNYSVPNSNNAECGTITCSPASGSFFPIGDTPVTCSSTAGPTCSFKITVNDTENPTITAPPDISVGNTPGQCSATVNPGTATTGDNCPGVTVSGQRSDGLALNAPYPLGTTTITWTATDAHDHTATATQKVEVRDAQAPSVTNVSATPSVLRPPDHTMRNVTVNYNAVDNCSAVTCTLSVTSNEPINGLGDGDRTPDWQIIDAHHVRLRAERSGTGAGRIYTITITCRDGAGNQTVKQTQVKVPR